MPEKGGEDMNEELFVRADEVAKELGVSKPFAYKLMQKLNAELAQKNYITISGRVSRRYFRERIYGLQDDNERNA